MSSLMWLGRSPLSSRRRARARRLASAIPGHEVRTSRSAAAVGSATDVRWATGVRVGSEAYLPMGAFGSRPDDPNRPGGLGFPECPQEGYPLPIEHPDCPNGPGDWVCTSTPLQPPDPDFPCAVVERCYDHLNRLVYERIVDVGLSDDCIVHGPPSGPPGGPAPLPPIAPGPPVGAPPPGGGEGGDPRDPGDAGETDGPRETDPPDTGEPGDSDPGGEDDGPETDGPVFGPEVDCEAMPHLPECGGDGVPPDDTDPPPTGPYPPGPTPFVPSFRGFWP